MRRAYTKTHRRVIITGACLAAIITFAGIIWPLAIWGLPLAMLASGTAGIASFHADWKRIVYAVRDEPEEIQHLMGLFIWLAIFFYFLVPFMVLMFFLKASQGTLFFYRL